MYEKVEKPKENNSSAAANSVTKKTAEGKQSIRFEDNRQVTQMYRTITQLVSFNDEKEAINSFRRLIKNDSEGVNLKKAIEYLEYAQEKGWDDLEDEAIAFVRYHEDINTSIELGEINKKSEIENLLTDYLTQNISEKNKRANRIESLLRTTNNKSDLERLITVADQEKGFLKLLKNAKAVAQKRLGLGAIKVAKNRIEHWLLEGETLDSAVLKCIGMDVDGMVSKGSSPHIIWSGGASGCVIIGTYNGQKSYMIHATPISWSMDTRSTASGVKQGGGAGSNVYIASERVGDGGLDALIRELQELGLNVIGQYKSTSMALDANSGKVQVDLDSSGLPK